MKQITEAISRLDTSQVRRLREAHGLDDRAPLALNWRLLPRWTPEVREAVAVALHDYALSQADACDALWAITAVDCRVGVWCACAVARTALRYVPDEEDRPRLVIEIAERSVRGLATGTECYAASLDAVAAFAAAINVASFAAFAAAAAARAAARAADAAAYAAYAAGDDARNAARATATATADAAAAAALADAVRAGNAHAARAVSAAAYAGGDARAAARAYAARATATAAVAVRADADAAAVAEAAAAVVKAATNSAAEAAADAAVNVAYAAASTERTADATGYSTWRAALKRSKRDLCWTIASAVRNAIDAAAEGYGR